MTSFHLIIAIAALLTTLGLIMVLSASGVRSYGDDGSAWVIFGQQVLWTIIGLVAFYLALRMPVRFMRADGVHRFRVTIIAAGAGAGPRNRQRGQRLPRSWFVDRGLLDAALRAGQDRVGDLGGPPVGRPPHGAGLTARDADPAGAGGGASRWR